MAQREYILGLDYGGKRIGVAIAHAVARLPRPLVTIENTTNAKAGIADIVEREQVAKVVIGLPRSMDGSIQAQAKLVEQFANELAGILPVPVVLVDETLTSVQAEQILATKKHHAAMSKSDVDALAAALILERFFEDDTEGQVI